LVTTAAANAITAAAISSTSTAVARTPLCLFESLFVDYCYCTFDGTTLLCGSTAAHTILFSLLFSSPLFSFNRSNQRSLLLRELPGAGTAV
jgi:hypothetical protein